MGIKYHLTAGTVHIAPLAVRIFCTVFTTPMLKNCKACKNKHSPPFGRYCKFVSGDYCVFCDIHHNVPVGLLCPTYLDRSEQFNCLETCRPSDRCRGPPLMSCLSPPPGGPLMGGGLILHVDFKKAYCRPVEFKNWSCRPVAFKKCPCPMSLSF